MSTPLEDYQTLLANHDWYSDLSDDSRVYRESQRQYRIILEQALDLDPELDIFNSFAPEEYKLTVNPISDVF